MIDADSSDEDEVIDVKEWRPDEHLEPLTTLTFICRRKSGKTNAKKDICERYLRHHIRHFVLFSPTADADSAAYPFIDRRFVFPRPSGTILRAWMFEMPSAIPGGLFPYNDTNGRVTGYRTATLPKARLASYEAYQKSRDPRSTCR